VSAVTERAAPIANSNANASQMTVCFIALPRGRSNNKSAVSLKFGTAAWQLQNQFGLVRGRLMALAGRPRGRPLRLRPLADRGSSQGRRGLVAALYWVADPIEAGRPAVRMRSISI
jgi:hypothetical protein